VTLTDSVERMLQRAERHGLQSGPEFEVGDLQEAVLCLAGLALGRTTRTKPATRQELVEDCCEALEGIAEGW